MINTMKRIIKVTSVGFKRCLPSVLALSLVLSATNVLAGKLTDGRVPHDAEKVCPIKVGQSLPDVNVQDVNGKAINLKDLVSKKPTVMIFYRGSWCPYCNVHLGELKKMETELEALGYQIIAMSPDLPKNLKESQDKHEMKYLLVSDSKAEASKALGLAFKVDADTYKKYLGYGINLEKASGEKHHILPVPAALVLDQEGLVHFSFASPNYKVRIDNDVLLSAAKAAVRK